MLLVQLMKSTGGKRDSFNLSDNEGVGSIHHVCTQTHINKILALINFFDL